MFDENILIPGGGGYIYMYTTIFSNIFSETAWPVKAKFHVEGGMKVCINRFAFLFNVPVNNFSVILGRSHRFLGINKYFWIIKVSCSSALHGGRGVRTLDLSIRSPKLYH